MDWSKIKSMLLVLLLVTNLLLGLVILNDRVLFNRTQDNNLEDVLMYLKSIDVGVKVDAFTFPEQIDSVYLDFGIFESKEPSSFFEGDFTKEGDSDFLDDTHRLRLTDNQIIWAGKNHFLRMQRDFATGFSVSKPLVWDESFDTLSQKALEMLERYGHSVTYQASELYDVGAYRLLIMQQKYKDITIEESGAIFWFYNDQLVGFKQLWPAEIVATEGQNYDILSVDLALYRGIHEFRKGDTIMDISLVYKLNDQSLLLSNLISGEALPYYRFQMESGLIHYVQAFDRN